MSITRLVCQVSKLINSDTCPRPTTGLADLAGAEHAVDCVDADLDKSFEDAGQEKAFQTDTAKEKKTIGLLLLRCAGGGRSGRAIRARVWTCLPPLSWTSVRTAIRNRNNLHCNILYTQLVHSLSTAIRSRCSRIHPLH